MVHQQDKWWKTTNTSTNSTNSSTDSRYSAAANPNGSPKRTLTTKSRTPPIIGPKSPLKIFLDAAPRRN